MPGCGYTGVPNNLRPFIKAFIIKLVTARQIIICIRATSMFFCFKKTCESLTERGLTFP